VTGGASAGGGDCAIGSGPACSSAGGAPRTVLGGRLTGGTVGTETGTGAGSVGYVETGCVGWYSNSTLAGGAPA
jgi:hypothetical protein